MESRKDLAKYFKNLGFNLGVEVGVLGGTYSIALCEANPELRLYCIDSWGLEERRYRRYHERKYEEAKIRLAPYNCILIRALSMDAVQNVKKGSLDFVYIDADHRFDYVMQDIIQWSKRVRAGGIVAGHDYGKESVRVAVDAYVSQHGLKVEVTKDKSWYFMLK